MNSRPTLAVLTACLLAPPAVAGKLVLVAGGGSGGDESQAVDAKLVAPFGVDFGTDGSTYLVEMAKGERLRRIDPNDVLTTVAGTGEKGLSGDGGPGPKATFNGMHSLAVGPDGRVYLADTWNNCVRRFDPKTAAVSRFAGTGEKGFAGDDGPAPSAKFGGVFSICFGPGGKALYLADLDNRRVRKIDMASGLVSTVAGNGARGVPKDGEPASGQPLVDPRAVAVDSRGNVYVLERSGHALRMIDPAGHTRTVAGTGQKGSGGVGGPALKCSMNGPKHLCVDRDDSVLIADTENHRILRYVPKDGTIALVAGTGRRGLAGVGGDPLKAELAQPHGVAVHPKTGELYITDSGNNRVLKIER